MQVIAQDNQSQTPRARGPWNVLQTGPLCFIRRLCGDPHLSASINTVVVLPTQRQCVRFSDLREDSQSHTRKSQVRRNSKGPGQLEDVAFL